MRRAVRSRMDERRPVVAKGFTVHWPNWDGASPVMGGAPGEPFAMLCGAPHLSREMYSEQIEHVTCPDCLFRVIALLQRDIGVAMKTLVGQFVIMKDNLERSARRD